jgi:hypothetical protein
MNRKLLYPCRFLFLVGALALTACDVSLAPDEGDQVDEGIWQGKPIKQWLLLEKSEKEEDGTSAYAKPYLDQIGPEETDLLPALKALLKDEEPYVRRGAARLIGQIGPNAKDAMEALEESMVDPDKGVVKETLAARKRIRGLKP